ncbi:MAG: hypothetical protein ACRDY2_14180 [Acidimicrobiales bacterium]
MNSTTYRVLCSYAGSYLVRPHPWPVPATEPFPLVFSSAVYIALDASGRCCYVGSVCRAVGGLRERVVEHLDDPAKRATWHVLWVLPLVAGTPSDEVRRIEGVVGAHLGPALSHRLPSPRPPSSGDANAVRGSMVEVRP